jgi:hypothetical protein
MADNAASRQADGHATNNAAGHGAPLFTTRFRESRGWRLSGFSRSLCAYRNSAIAELRSNLSISGSSEIGGFETHRFTMLLTMRPISKIARFVRRSTVQSPVARVRCFHDDVWTIREGTMAVSPKVATRISTELKRYQSILQKAQQRDISESDTVVIIGDMLSDVLGYDKYQHVTTEFAIRGTYVDLAVRTDNQIRFLIEAKAIGIELNDSHIMQAVDYAANQGIDWVVLSNGAHWRIYKVQFTKPIDKILICDINALTANPRSEEVVECLGCLSREGFSKSAMSELLQQKQVTSKFTIAAVLLTDSVIEHLRRDIRRLSGIRVEPDYLKDTLQNEIIKRELIEGDDATAALATVKKMQRALARERKKADEEEDTTLNSDAPASGGASNSVTSSGIPLEP